MEEASLAAVPEASRSPESFRGGRGEVGDVVGVAVGCRALLQFQLHVVRGGIREDGEGVFVHHPGEGHGHADDAIPCWWGNRGLIIHFYFFLRKGLFIYGE